MNDACLCAHRPSAITRVHLKKAFGHKRLDEIAVGAVTSFRAELVQRVTSARSESTTSSWCSRSHSSTRPWTYAETPGIAARYWTRDLWFWSRQIADLRRDPAWRAPSVPDAWRACAAEVASGAVGALDLRAGLLSLTRMLCAGQVVPPWHLGLQVADFADSFEDDMAYADAFRLWGMSAFDDDEQIRRYLDQYTPPDASWTQWIAEQLRVD